MNHFLRLTLTLAMMCGMTQAISAGEAQTIRYGEAGTPAKNFGPPATAETGWNFPSKFYGGAVIWLTPDKRELYAGNSISKVIFYHGTINDESVTTVNVFASEGLNGKELMNQDLTFSQRIAEEMTYEFNPPLLIEPGDETLYIGWRVNITNNSPWSNIWTTDLNRSLPAYYNDAILFQNDEWKLQNMGGEAGNMCIWLEITGEEQPTNDVSVHTFSIPRQISPDEEFTYKFFVQNLGMDAVNTITVETTFTDTDPVTQEIQFATPLKRGAQTECILKGKYPSTGVVHADVRVTQVNGVDDMNMTDNALEDYTLSTTPQDGYDRNVLIEEAGGTWCEACPRGIVGMREMAEKYAHDGRLSLISVHGGDTDPMAIDTYESYNRTFIMSYPLATIDRVATVNPMFSELERCYKQRLEAPAYSRLEIEATPDEEARKIDIQSNATFYFNDFGERYRIAYVLVENNVGPYPQANGYSGSEEEMGGFEKLEPITKILFNDVAVSSTDALGVADAYPDRLEAGKNYTHSMTLDLPEGCKLEDCRVVAYLVNARTNAIENCAQTTEITGTLESIASDHKDARAEFYNMQGIRTEPSAPGVYICRQGNRSVKVLVK